MAEAGIWRLDRDRAIVLGGCISVSALAWLFVLHNASPAHMRTSAAMHLGALFLMWAVMMVAMMLPSTLPYLFAFSGEQVRRRRRGLTVVPVAFFLTGYFAVWTTFSAGCAALQALLHTIGLLSPMMFLSNLALAGLVLLAGGLYQWSPLKQACLHHCRSPLGFLLSDWREGRSGAFRMGVDHGVICVGCCWALMLLPFAAGVMNLAGMAGISALLLLEKAAPGGPLVGRICGAVLVVTGAWMLGFGVIP